MRVVRKLRARHDARQPGKETAVARDAERPIRLRPLETRLDEAGGKGRAGVPETHQTGGGPAGPAPALPPTESPEYANSIRDPCRHAVGGDWVPPDDSSEGFDNVARVPSHLPALIYRATPPPAMKLSRAAVAT